jgi:hypothetical protein
MIWGNTVMREVKICARLNSESAMTEVEFDRLLDAVRTAISPLHPPKATNDNQLAWSLIPFPEGWNAG